MADPPHVHDRHGPEARRALEREALIPHTLHEREIARGLELGLQGADSIVDRTIPTFSRGELPHYAGINTFLKAPFVEGRPDLRLLRRRRPGGAARLRDHVSSGHPLRPPGHATHLGLYGTYSFELGVDLRESITICDLGDIFTIPGNIEKTFDQISKAVSHVFASGALPVVLGGEHSIGSPTVRGVAEHSGAGRPPAPASRSAGSGRRRSSP